MRDRVNGYIKRSPRVAIAVALTNFGYDIRNNEIYSMHFHPLFIYRRLLVWIVQMGAGSRSRCLAR